MSKIVDGLSKDLAGGMSRRKAFGRFLAGIGGALLLGRRASADGNNVCVQFCRAFGNTGADFGLCVAASAQCPAGECALITNSGQPFCVAVG